MAVTASTLANPSNRSDTRSPNDSAGYLNPATLMQVQSLELRAKAVVEGFFNGLHRSPYHGFSVEFTEYREYSPGDDLRYLDWRLFARSDRYYVKRFEDETNLRCYLLVDNSKSMGFSSGEFTKADYGKTLAASLAYFLTTQRDACGLLTFDEHIDENIPPRYRPGHMRRLLLALEKPVSGKATDISKPLEQIAQQVSKRGMMILISDLLAPIESLETNLAYLTARGHEVILFQILDPAELTLSFDAPVLFEDLESGQELYIDPDDARADYQRRFQQHGDEIRRTCDKLGIARHQFSTDTPLELALIEFMAGRMHRSSKVTRRNTRPARRPA